MQNKVDRNNNLLRKEFHILFLSQWLFTHTGDLYAGESK